MLVAFIRRLCETLFARCSALRSRWGWAFIALLATSLAVSLNFPDYKHQLDVLGLAPPSSPPAFGICSQGPDFLYHARGITGFSKPGGFIRAPDQGMVLSTPTLVTAAFVASTQRSGQSTTLVNY